MLNLIYTGILTLIIMLLLHHLYNYLQSNLTIPKVNQINTTIVNDLQEVNKMMKRDKEKEKEDPRKDELKEYLNQFKKK